MLEIIIIVNDFFTFPSTTIFIIMTVFFFTESKQGSHKKYQLNKSSNLQR